MEKKINKSRRNWKIIYITLIESNNTRFENKYISKYVKFLI